MNTVRSDKLLPPKYHKERGRPTRKRKGVVLDYVLNMILNVLMQEYHSTFICVLVNVSTINYKFWFWRGIPKISFFRLKIKHNQGKILVANNIRRAHVCTELTDRNPGSCASHCRVFV
jgi:hypothetical protein